MAVNGYFNNFPTENRITNEHRFLEDVIVESIQVMGHNVYYIPRESFDAGDMIFGEYSKSKFDRAYLIEAYLANVEGFEGDGDFFSKFGLEIRDTSNFILSKRSFNKIIPSTIRERPQEGDLVFVPLMNRMFEIKFIEKKLNFFSLGNRQPFIFEMRCELFRFSEDQIATGIEDIDMVAENNSYTTRINLQTTGTGSFVDGETIYQSANGNWNGHTAHATIKEWYAGDGTMLIYDITGAFTANANVYGNTTSAIYKVLTIADEKQDFVTNDFFDNKEFADGTVGIVDLSETNPFGTP